MDSHQVASSNIRAIGYDTTTQTLEVEFPEWLGLPVLWRFRIPASAVHAVAIQRAIPQPIHQECYPYSRVG